MLQVTPLELSRLKEIEVKTPSDEILLIEEAKEFRDKLKRCDTGLKKPKERALILNRPPADPKIVRTIRVTQFCLALVNAASAGLGIYNIMTADGNQGGWDIQSSSWGGVLAVTATGLLVCIMGYKYSAKDQKIIENLLKDIQERCEELVEEKQAFQAVQIRALKHLLALYQRSNELEETGRIAFEESLKSEFKEYFNMADEEKVGKTFLKNIKELHAKIQITQVGRQLELEDFESYLREENQALEMTEYFPSSAAPTRQVARHERSLCSKLSFYVGNPLLSAMNCVGSLVLLLTTVSTLDKAGAICTGLLGLIMGGGIQLGINKIQQAIDDLEFTKETQHGEINLLKDKIHAMSELIILIKRMDKEVNQKLLMQKDRTSQTEILLLRAEVARLKHEIQQLKNPQPKIKKKKKSRLELRINVPEEAKVRTVKTGRDSCGSPLTWMSWNSPKPVTSPSGREIASPSVQPENPLMSPVSRPEKTEESSICLIS